MNILPDKGLRSASILLVLLLSMGLISCGSGSSDVTPTEIATTNRVITSVSISDGNNQIATVGTDLPNPLVAMIMNSEGQAIADQLVSFWVTAGEGYVFSGTAISDANGYVRERWTLGTVAGKQKVEVRAVDSMGAAVVFALFEAMGTADSPETISLVSGDNQTAQQLHTLPLPVKIVVKDSYGNPTPGAQVTFIVDNGGTPTPEIATTNVLGEAETIWTLGLTVGYHNLNASIAGLTSINFIATVSRAPPSAATAIEIVSGDAQDVVQHLALPVPLYVIVVDVLGNPVPDTQVTFSASAGSGYVPPSIVTSDSNGYAMWNGYFHIAGEQMLNASTIEIGSVTFLANVIASTHMYDGEYLCNETSSPFPMNIINGVHYSGGRSGTLSGTVNEQDGTYTGAYNYRDLATEVTGVIVIDSQQRALLTGTIKVETAWFDPEPWNISPWSCYRK